MSRQIVPIVGMHCVACEERITQELKKLPGVARVQVSHLRHRAEIHWYDQPGELNMVRAAVERAGYHLGDQNSVNQANQPTRRATGGQWLIAVVVTAVLWLIYRLVVSWGIINPTLDPNTLGPGVALIVGIVASLSTCLVVIGSVVMSFGAKYQASGTFYQARVRPHLLFHVGRLAAFFLLGGLLGVLGQWIDISLSATGWLMLIVGVALLVLGLNILGLAPSPSAFGLHLPRRVLRWWDKIQSSEHRAAPLLLGAFTFFLPCGFTQTMQLFAISAGGFWRAGFTLLFFALGTMPVLLAIGIASASTRQRRMVVAQKVIGFILFLFSFSILANGLVLLGVDLSRFGTKNNHAAANIDAAGNVQVVRMTVGNWGYEPNVLTIQSGVPVRWLISSNGNAGCASSLVVPSMGIRKFIGAGETEINFTPTGAGTIPFSCSMGMYRGRFVVTDAKSATTTAPPIAAPITNEIIPANSSCYMNTAGKIICE